MLSFSLKSILGYSAPKQSVAARTNSAIELLNFIYFYFDQKGPDCILIILKIEINSSPLKINEFEIGCFKLI